MGERWGTKGQGAEKHARFPKKNKRITAQELVLSVGRSSFKQIGVENKEARCEKGKGQATQQHTYQAQRPCPPPGSVSRFKKSQPCFVQTHIGALLLEGWSLQVYLSTAFARKDIVLHGALQVVVHGCWLVLCCLLWPNKGRRCWSRSGAATVAQWRKSSMGRQRAGCRPG